MKKHNGMRPQDIVILLKMTTYRQSDWRLLDLANDLKISHSEVSEALNRCRVAGLVDADKRVVFTGALSDFLIHGLRYIFPVELGAVVRGVATAHSAPPVSLRISGGSEVFVWPYAKGQHRGQSIDPLYKTVPDVVQNDTRLYELLAIADTLRIGRAREIEIATEELNLILDAQQY